MNKTEKCTRTGYDLYSCSCSKCIELDMQREENEEKGVELLTKVKSLCAEYGMENSILLW